MAWLGWMQLVSERSVQEAFSKAKADIASVRRSLDTLKKRSDDDKKEFYEFIKALDARLEKLQASLASKEDLDKAALANAKEHEKASEKAEKSVSSLKEEIKSGEKSLSQLNEQIKALKKSADRISSAEKKLDSLAGNAATREQLSSQLDSLRQELKSARKKMADVELKAAEIPDFSRITGRLDELETKFADTKKLVKEADIKELQLELRELTKEFSRLNSRFPGWKDLEKDSKKGEQAAEALNARLEQELAALNEKIAAVGSSVRDSSKGFVSSEDFEKHFDDLHGKVKKVQDSVNFILKSEVDLAEYALKDDLKDSLQDLKKEVEKLRKDYDKRLEKSESEFKERLRKSSADVKDLENNLEILSARAERASSELAGRLESAEKLSEQREFRKLKEDIDYVKANLVTQKDLDRAVGSVYDEISEVKSKTEFKYEPSVVSERTNVGNYITALVLVFVLVALGYYVYTQLSPQQFFNATAGPTTMLPSFSNQSNLSPALAPQNVTVLTTAMLAEKSKDCVLGFECTKDRKGDTNYNCSYSIIASDCRCYKGGTENCPEQKMAMLSAMREEGSKNESAAENPVSAIWGNYRLHLIAFISIAAFALLLIYLLKKGEEAAKKEESHGKKRKKNKEE